MPQDIFLNTTMTIKISPDEISSRNAIARVEKARSYFLFKFEEIPFVDSISQRKLSISGSDVGIVEKGYFGNALMLRPGTSYSYDFSIDSLEQFSVGFWLLPVSLRSTSVLQKEQSKVYRMSLLDKSLYSYNSASNSVVPSQMSFSIFEECLENGNNVIKIALEDADTSETIILSSEEYSVGVFHHFWLAYNGPSGLLKLYIDGKETTLTFDIGDGIPSSIANYSNSPFHINYSALGNSSLLRNNSGILDEFCMISNGEFDLNKISRIINLGIEYEINSSFVNRYENSEAFIYNDPNTLSINAVCSNGKNVYAGKGNGKMYKGERAVWQSKKDFSNPAEIEQIRSRLLSENESIVAISEGQLKIKKANIRI